MKEVFEGKTIGENKIVKGELIVDGLKYYIRHHIGYGTSTVAVYPNSIRKVKEQDGICNRVRSNKV